MIAFAFVRQEEPDIQRLQGSLIESQRTFDVADSQNHVIEHYSLLQITSALTAFSPLETAWIASGGMLKARPLACPRKTGFRDASIRDVEGLL
jgi:hypothetical protein